VPPLHFKRKAVVEAALSAWSSQRLARTMELLAEALLNVRRTPALADALGHRAMLQVAGTGKRGGRQ